MKVNFKSVVAAAAFMSAGLASAAIVTVPADGSAYKGLTVSGTGTLTLSTRALAALNAFGATLLPQPPGITTEVRDTRGRLLGASVAMPLATVSVDAANDQVQRSTHVGGVVLSVPTDQGLFDGGNVSLQDLEVDLVTRTVYGTLTGDNGVGTLVRFPLWTIGTVTGVATVTAPTSGATAVNRFTVSGLALTPQALGVLAVGLGVAELGTNALQAITDFGTLAVDIRAVPVLTPPPCTVRFTTTAPVKGGLLSTNEVTVQNPGSTPATGWSVTWNYAAPTLALNPKNAKLSQTGYKVYTAKPLAANTSLAAGSATTFSFRSYAVSGSPKPTSVSATLGGQSCQVTAP